uniref:uncharacterized protein LOC120327510 n=1 Tax=Styela clava TaxID=7725 RepID=UPI001939EC9E|nr:uncharacterized protein LOC120327510 [Styela clava]
MIKVFRSEDEDTRGILIADGFFNWDLAESMIIDGNYNFGRTYECARRYKKHMTSVGQEWDSIDSLCRSKFLGFPYSTKSIETFDDDGTTRGKRIVKFVDMKVNPEGFRVVIVENEFPYALTPDIRHFIIWSCKDISLEEYLEQVEKEFPRNKFDIIIFENPSERKSVNGVSHAQVFVRDKTGVSGA